jgi:hypothetical protein
MGTNADNIPLTEMTILPVSALVIAGSWYNQVDSDRKNFGVVAFVQ